MAQRYWSVLDLITVTLGTTFLYLLTEFYRGVQHLVSGSQIQPPPDMQGLCNMKPPGSSLLLVPSFEKTEARKNWRFPTIAGQNLVVSRPPKNSKSFTRVTRETWRSRRWVPPHGSSHRMYQPRTPRRARVQTWPPRAATSAW